MAKDKQPKKTKVFLDEFKGNEMFGVWEVDDDRNKVGAFPLVSFGKTKAQYLVEHIEELKEFVGE